MFRKEKPVALSNTERQQYINKWNKNNRDKPWEVVWPEMLEDQDKMVEQIIAFRGEIIYTPQNCIKPDSKSLPVGTIYECHAYHERNRCYDQWIIEESTNGPVWVLFKRHGV
jgi:hypothetical protein